MRCRRKSGNVADDEVYVRELTTALEKIRIAAKRAEVRRSLTEQLGNKPQILVRKTTLVYQKPSTGEFAKYSVNKVISFNNTK